MPIKDLDELAYGTSEAEKISHLAVLILKHGHRLQTLQDVCDICFDSLPPKFEKHVTEITEGFDNLIEECDTMLKLTDKKTAIQFADTCIRRQKQGEQKLEKAASLAKGEEITETPLDRLICMNLKFNSILHNQSETNSKRAAKKRKKRSPVAATPPSNISFPYIVDGETHTTFHLNEKKVFKLPNPSSKEHPKLYSLREIVLHLAPYKGTRKLIEYLNKSGRIAFHRNTVERHAEKYKNNKELPDEGIMFSTLGRPSGRPGITVLNDKVRKPRSEPNSKRAAKKRKKRSPVAATPPSNISSFPCIVDGETHTAFHLSEKKVFELPNPSSKEHPKLYSLREIVLHLAPYKGTRNLIEYLKKSGRITFSRNTVEHHARKYKNDKKLPDEGIMFSTLGRPSGRPGITVLNDKVKESSNTGCDVIELATKQRLMQSMQL